MLIEGIFKSEKNFTIIFCFILHSYVWCRPHAHFFKSKTTIKMHLRALPKRRRTCHHLIQNNSDFPLLITSKHHGQPPFKASLHSGELERLRATLCPQKKHQHKISYTGARSHRPPPRFLTSLFLLHFALLIIRLILKKVRIDKKAGMFRFYIFVNNPSTPRSPHGSCC